MNVVESRRAARARPRVITRMLATAPLPSALIVVLVAVIAMIAAVAPVRLENARAETVANAVASLPPLARDVTATTSGAPVASPGEDSWAGVQAAVREISQQLPTTITAVVREPHVVATIAIGDAAPLDAAHRPPPAELTLAITPDLAERVEIVEGRAAKAFTGTRHEVVMSEAASERLEWPVGQQRTTGVADATIIELVGVFRPIDADDSAWAHTTSALEPQEVILPDGGKIILATMFAAPDDLPSFAAGRENEARTAVWYPMAADRVRPSSAAALAGDLRAISAQTFRIPVAGDGLWQPGFLTLRSTASDTIDAGLARGAAMTAVLSTVAVGPAAVALVALSLAVRMLADRRMPSVRLMRARGASWSRLLAILGAEGLVLGAIGALLGTAVATALVGWSGGGGIAVGALLAVVPAAVLPAVALTRDRTDQRRDLGVTTGARAGRRLALEAIIVVLTAGVVWLVASRTEPVTGLDPVLLALPIGLTSAGGALAMRVLPLVLSVAERRGASRRSLVPLLGPARARRDPAVRLAPVLAVVVGVAVTMFSVAFSATMADGIRSQSRAQAGADLHVLSPYIRADAIDAARSIAGVDAVAPVYSATREKLTGERAVSIALYAVDAGELRRVQHDMGALALTPPPVDDVPGAEGAPIILSQEAADVAGVTTTDEVKIGRRGEAYVAGVFAGTAPFPDVERWALVDRSRLGDLLSAGDAPTQLFLALDDSADVAAVTAEVSTLMPTDDVVTPAGIERERTTDPALTAITAGVVAAAAIVAVLLGVAVAMTLVLGARGRGRLLALLRTLGHRRGGEASLVAWEVTPALACALPFGVVAGVAMAHLVLPAIDLRGFVGGHDQPSVHDGGWTGLLVVGGFIVVAALAVALATLIATRVTTARAVRSIEEEDR